MVSEGVGGQHLPGRSNFFQGGGGVQMLISIETHITCDLPGGVRTPYPPSGSAYATRYTQSWKYK